jgi:serine/threonine-protein kinase
MSPSPTVAHYRIASKLGEGGMGAVYRATDTKLNRDVAIKVLPDAFASDSDRLARFTREAQVLASLNHPNIAAIYGVEERALVLELVDGSEPRGPLASDEALPIVRQLIDALEYAHDKGIVHRDLKPANLKVTAGGRLKVLDFGLAKALASETAASDPRSSPTLTMRATMAGVIMGTAGYMSPEQARGHEVDRRADIWAFGVIVYELLTGRALFEGPTVSDTLAAVLTRDPDFDAAPPRFRRLLRLCLARDCRERLSHISAARVLLDEAPPAASPRRPRLWIASTAALAILSLATGFLAWRAMRPVLQPMMRLSVDLGPDALPVMRNAAHLSPDGTRLLHVVLTRDRKEALATRLLDKPALTLLPGTENPSSPGFSPDGQSVAFIAADGKLKRVSLAGGASVVVCDVSRPPRGMAWGLDGSIVFAVDSSSGLRRVSASGGEPREITKLEGGYLTHRWPQFLPGGRRILFTANKSTVDFNDADIAAADLATGEVKIVHRGGYFARYVPSGHLLFARGAALFGIRFDPDRLAVTGEPVPLIDDLGAVAVVGNGRFSVSDMGTLVYMAGRSFNVSAPVVWLEPPSQSAPVLPLTARYSTPTIAPDGRSMALTMGNYSATDIYIWDFRREAMIRLTVSAQGNAFPVWTPDGKRLAYASGGSGRYTLWIARADGGGESVRLLDSATELIPTSFSPDGRRLAYSTAAPDTFDDIYVLPLDWSDPSNPKPGKPELFLRTAGVDLGPRFSPDGRWIAYSSTEAGRAETYVRPYPGPGGRWQVSTAGGNFPRWAPSGRQIFFLGLDGKIMVSDVETKGAEFSSAKPRVWFHAQLGQAPRWTTFDVAPDGKRIIAFVPAVESDGQSTVHATFVINFFDELRRRIP